MRNQYLKALLPILSMTVFGYADQAAADEKKSIDQTKPHFIQYHNRVILFAPFHQGYERIKPDAFYVGIEGFLASGLNKGKDNTLLDLELRMGYNFFFKEKDHLTPFVGIGFVEDFFRHHDHLSHKPGIVYGTTGFLYDHEFNTIFSLGINAKLLIGGPVSKKRFDWGSPVIGTDISLPITFRFGHHRHWDYRIEPFNMYLHGSKASQDYFGFRNSLGYRF
jgi:hypothetical protein